jgi:hypothetical protein
MKSENLNFLEPSGPLQAGNGTALPFITGSKRVENNKEKIYAILVSRGRTVA